MSCRLPCSRDASFSKQSPPSVAVSDVGSAKNGSMSKPVTDFRMRQLNQEQPSPTPEPTRGPGVYSFAARAPRDLSILRRQESFSTSACHHAPVAKKSQKKKGFVLAKAQNASAPTGDDPRRRRKVDDASAGGWSGANVGSLSGWDLARALVQEWQETSFCGLAALDRYWRGGKSRNPPWATPGFRSLEERICMG